jgi:hypothetical protein
VQSWLQQSVATLQLAPCDPQAQVSARQLPLQHSEFAKQPPTTRQQPPSKQVCPAVHSALEVQPCTGATQKPPEATPVQQAAAELVGRVPVMQQTPASQAPPVQQGSELQDVPGSEQVG